MCIYLLAMQHTVEHCIIHFVALEVIMEVTKLYFESLIDNKLRSVVHHSPKYDSSLKPTFYERSCFHKFGRIIYKMLRAIYVSFIYYFIPYWIILLFWVIPNDEKVVHH